MGMSSDDRHHIDSATNVGNVTELVGVTVLALTVIGAVVALVSDAGWFTAVVLVVAGAAAGFVLISLAAMTKAVAVVARSTADR